MNRVKTTMLLAALTALFLWVGSALGGRGGLAISIVLAAAFLGEGLHSIQTFGIVLVLAAIVIVQLPGRNAGGAEDSVVVEPSE